uniref:Uncharacterized protein n=1 Tax=Oryza meridionalis TaxID=40149 RepID=A0A0E0EAA5_9ORYZ
MVVSLAGVLAGLRRCVVRRTSGEGCGRPPDPAAGGPGAEEKVAGRSGYYRISWARQIQRSTVGRWGRRLPPDPRPPYSLRSAGEAGEVTADAGGQEAAVAGSASPKLVEAGSGNRLSGKGEEAAAPSSWRPAASEVEGGGRPRQPVVYRTISLMQRWRIMLKGDMLVMPNKWMEEVMIKPLHLKLINLPEAF